MFDNIKTIPVECFRVSETEKNTLEIPFDEIFGGDLKFLNQFKLNKKRAYVNIMDKIAETNNLLLARLKDKEDIIYNYVAIKYNIDVKTYKTAEEFIEQVKEYIIEEIHDDVVSFVDDNYIFDLDSQQVNVNTKYKESLQFTDHHNKILFRNSTTMKFAIPLFLHYAQTYSVSDMGDFLLKCFDPIFDNFSEDGKIDILAKLYESVYSRVIVTRYSDRKFWYYCEIMGLNIEGLADESVKKLIRDIVPKYTFDKNPVSLNHVVVQNNVGYFFRINFSLSFKSLNISESTNDNEISDYDKLTINQATVNESDICLNKANIRKTIKHIAKQFQVEENKAEVDYYLKTFKLNKLQRNLLFLFYAKYFGSTNCMYYCNARDYVTLLVMMKQYLARHNFTYLDKILTADVEHIEEKKSLNKAKANKVMMSEKYINIIESNYSEATLNIQESNSIFKLISTLTTNTFTNNDYNGENNGSNIELDHDVVADELLRVLAML